MKIDVDIIEDIIDKLVGEIRPVGETNEDNKRFENLQAMCALANRLIIVIDNVGYDFKDRVEFSMKRASNYASKYLTKTIGITN